MTTIWFIRHGESASNAGLPTTSAASPVLTERGVQQADLVAKFIPRQPDLIAASSYLRTQLTAEPVLERFPAVPYEIWPVHEFTYLSSRHYQNATVKDRRSSANRYFLQANPEYHDGDKAESFNMMIDRVEQTFDKSADNPGEFLLVFTHGWFIRAMLWKIITDQKLKSGRSKLLDHLRDIRLISRPYYLFLNYSRTFRRERSKMWHYLVFSAAIHLPNASILEFETDPQERLVFKRLILEHLPAELIGSKYMDR